MYMVGFWLTAIIHPPPLITLRSGQKYSIHISKNGDYFMHSFAEAASPKKRGLPNSIDMSYVFNLHSYIPFCIISQLMERQNSLRQIVCRCGES